MIGDGGDKASDRGWELLAEAMDILVLGRGAGGVVLLPSV